MTASKTIDVDSMAEAIRTTLAHLPTAPWLPEPVTNKVELLAAGTYHLNFTVDSGGQRSVARVVRSSQWGLPPDKQIRKEFAVLMDLRPSGVAPIPHGIFDAGSHLFMVESYASGDHIDHHKDLDQVVGAIAAAHRCRPASSLPLLDATSPDDFLIQESAALLGRCRPPATSAEALRLVNRALVAIGRQRLPAATKPPVLLHTDLIQTNLLVNEHGCVIVDWEGARLGPPAWDLAYFMSPLTLGWAEPQVALDYDEQDRVISAYCKESGISPDALASDVKALLPFVMLRAFAWCLDYRGKIQDQTSRSEKLDALTSPSFIASAFAHAGVIL